MRSLLTLLTAALMLTLVACSDSEPVSAPTLEPADEPAPAPAAPESSATDAPATAEEEIVIEEEAESEAEAEAVATPLAAGESGDPPTGIVVFENVTSQARYKPLVGASVAQYGVSAGPKATTDAKGHFNLDLVASPTQALLVTADGYVSSLTTFLAERAKGKLPPIMMYDHDDEAAISKAHYGFPYDPKAGGVVLNFESVGEAGKLTGLSTMLSARNLGGLLFPSNPAEEGVSEQGSKLGEDDAPMVFYPGVTPGKTKITVTVPAGVTCSGPASADVLADTYTTVLFSCS